MEKRKISLPTPIFLFSTFSSSSRYKGSRFFSVFSSGPTFRRLYVTLYSTVCFFPGDRSMKYLTCCWSTRSTRPAIVCRST